MLLKAVAPLSDSLRVSTWAAKQPLWVRQAEHAQCLNVMGYSQAHAVLTSVDVTAFVCADPWQADVNPFTRLDFLKGGDVRVI